MFLLLDGAGRHDAQQQRVAARKPKKKLEWSKILTHIPNARSALMERVTHDCT
jgi:hypothetical protein